MKKLSIVLAIGLSLNLIGCGSNKITSNNVAAKETNSNSQLEYYFPRANQHPDQQLISVIDSSKSSLDIAIYSLTKKNIVNAIINAKKRGVEVRIISDKTESGNKYQKQELALLKNANIPIKINSHSGLMHLKVTIADKNIVTTGSYNYTDGATNLNDEVLVVIHDNKIATNFDNEFNTMWNDSKNFKNY